MSRSVDFDNNRASVRYKPQAVNSIGDFRREAVKIIGDRSKILAGEHRKFVTFGSCFATNVAAALQERGVNVYTTCITEDVNSPFNNRFVMRHIFLNESCRFTEELRDETEVDYAELKRKFGEASDIIFTLGNIFHLADGSVVSKNGTRLEAESFSETVECIKEIVSLLKSHTKANLFLSVSPVPISGYRGEAFQTAIEADCFSKCQLLAAVRVVGGFIYLPTFEIFRWLAAHQSFPTFGDGNGNQRHIFREQINTVMEALCG